MINVFFSFLQVHATFKNQQNSNEEDISPIHRMLKTCQSLLDSVIMSASVISGAINVLDNWMHNSSALTGIYKTLSETVYSSKELPEKSQ